MKHLVLLSLILLTACAGYEGDPHKAILTQASYSDMPGWSSDKHAEAYKVFVDSCRVNDKRPSAYVTKAGNVIGDRTAWRNVCALTYRFANPTDGEARKFFEANFTPYRITTPSSDKGRLTGYYEPLLRGSLKREGRYQTPVYGMPSGSTYPSRAAIEAGALRGRAPVLLYVDDPVMLFFLHIQGSGKVRLPDGRIVGINYAGQNGHNYIAIGRVMKEEGLLEEVTMQTIRDWLYANPRDAQRIMNTNPSYIFFKKSPGDQMAKGALGIPLTAGRSLAVDDERSTYGVPIYIATMSHNARGYEAPYQRLLVAQDTGGALIGAHRGDIFFGRGELEEWQAGHQNALGKVFWLLPNTQGVGLKFLDVF
ncbi:MAG: MltA domain-containing protein [Alphaproteobacteria bacterium]|nr:MltA domain-containing protein [Alphaproteobacteria bacterium]